jgi:murein DD-endopeptidase MepM/ murein hydrolase activator NlpD
MRPDCAAGLELRRRPRPAGRVTRSALWLALLAGAVLVGQTVTSPVAVAAPDTSASSAGAAAASQAAPGSDVERLQAAIDAAQDTLDQATVDAEATADVLRVAQDDLASAQQQADSTQAALAAAQSATGQAEDEVTELARESFMNGGDLTAAATLLSAQGPSDLIQRTATMDLLGEDRTERLQAAVSAEQQQETAAQAAAAAVAARDQAVAAAAQAQAQAAAELTQAQAIFAAAEAQQNALNDQLQTAQLDELSQQGVDDPESALAAQQRAAAAGANAGTGQLVTGRVTSCFGNRGGTMHYGIDIAAPIGTPIYAPEGGTVIDAGPANGFGLAVYLQHPDGTVTVYGHINDYFVTAGQSVAAGDVIAEVGNTGQSTGPHLHIETHVGGLYANRVNPVSWLAARGITLGGRCS